MKITLLISVSALILFASSCRTTTPIDPATMEPSTRCLPGAQVTVVYSDSSK